MAAARKLVDGLLRQRRGEQAADGGRRHVRRRQVGVLVGEQVVHGDALVLATETELEFRRRAAAAAAAAAAPRRRRTADRVAIRQRAPVQQRLRVLEVLGVLGVAAAVLRVHVVGARHPHRRQTARRRRRRGRRRRHGRRRFRETRL